MITIQQENPGLSRFRKQTVTSLEVVSRLPAALYSYTFRNAAATPVYVNLYDAPPTSITVGGITPTVPIKRIAVPAAPTGGFGEKVMSPGAFPIAWCASAMCICPVTTDADSAAAAGTVSVELDYAADSIVPTLQGN